MKIEYLLYIIEIAKCESISKAARKLYVTQPALSNIVQNMEDELGFSIFDRTPWGVQLTENGKKLVADIENIAKSMDSIMQISQGGARKTMVNIAAIPICCNSLIIDLIAEAGSALPDVELRVRELRHRKIIDAITGGETAIAIGSYTPASKAEIMQSAQKRGINIEHVIDDRIVAYLPKKHPLALESSLQISQLANDRPIIFCDSVPMVEDGQEAPSMRTLNSSLEFYNRESIKKAVSKGMGYSLLPYSMAIDDIYVQTGMISVVPVSDVDLPVGIFLAYRDGNLLPEERKVLTLLRGLCQSMAAVIKEKLSCDRNDVCCETLSDIRILY